MSGRWRRARVSVLAPKGRKGGLKRPANSRRDAPGDNMGVPKESRARRDRERRARQRTHPPAEDVPQQRGENDHRRRRQPPRKPEDQQALDLLRATPIVPAARAARSDAEAHSPGPMGHPPVGPGVCQDPRIHQPGVREHRSAEVLTGQERRRMHAGTRTLLAASRMSYLASSRSKGTSRAPSPRTAWKPSSSGSCVFGVARYRRTSPIPHTASLTTASTSCVGGAPAHNVAEGHA